MKKIILLICVGFCIIFSNLHAQIAPCNLNGASIYIDNSVNPRMMNATVNGMSTYSYVWTDINGTLVGTANQIPFYTQWCVTIVDNLTGCDTTICQDCIADTNALCMCMMIYMPVCGCDGFMYSNSCLADCADVSWVPAVSNGMPGGFLPCSTWTPTTGPPPCEVEIDGDSIICNWGTPQILEASPTNLSNPFVSYLWSTGQTGHILTISTPGTYCVLATDATGCVDSACITVSVQDIPIYTNPSPPIVCLGDSIVMEIDTVGLSNIIWIPNSLPTPPVHRIVLSPMFPITCVVEAIDNAGCERRGEVLIEVDSCNNGPCAIPFLYVEHDTATSMLEASQNSSNFSYQWSNGATTHYTSYYPNWCLYVVDLNGCDTTICEIVSSFSEKSSIEINIYPNPTRSDMIFDFPYNEIFNLEIFDLRGRLLVFDSNIKNRFIIKEGDLLQGTYIVKILHKNTLIVRKIIIE